VNTAATPGCARASCVSIEVMRACASVDRTIAAYSIPGRFMSSV
jgi:hypothetical protein